MKKIIFLSVLFFIILIVNSYCQSDTPLIDITAKEWGPEVGRLDFKVDYDPIAIKGQEHRNYERKILYICKYHILYITIANNSKEILHINPDFFTLVTDNKRSYAYSPETYNFIKKMEIIKESPVENVDIYPGTISEGFLLFEKTEKNERPAILYFKNPEHYFPINVLLDEKVKTKE